MNFNEHLGKIESLSYGDKIQKDKVKAEQDLVEMTDILDVLKNAVTSSDEDIEVEGREMQIEYSHLRVDLNHVRNKSASLSSQKVLFLVSFCLLRAVLFCACVGVGFECP